MLDPAEWPEMRDHVLPAEFDVYANLCRSVKDSDAAGNGKVVGHSELPIAPPQPILTLDDLAAAEAARKELQRACSPAGTVIKGSLPRVQPL